MQERSVTKRSTDKGGIRKITCARTRRDAAHLPLIAGCVIPHPIYTACYDVNNPLQVTQWEFGALYKIWPFPQLKYQ